jgi:membrane fusion protein, multidrug efflux system
MSGRRLLGPSVGIALLLILASAIYLRVRGTAEADASPPTDPEDLPEVSAGAAFRTDVAIPVSGAEVVRDTLVISVSAAAEAAAWRESRVVAKVEAPVARIVVRENQRVASGAVLIEMDTTDLALAVDEAEADVASADATYRELTLFDDQITDDSLRTERERIARARSGLDRAEVGLRRARIELARANVAAPFAGRVANVQVSEGHRVNPGDALMTVVDIDPIKVEVQVLESEVGFIAEGRSAQVTFAAFPGEIFVGRISTINPMVERESRTARVTVTIPNPEGRILPGMYARVSLEARRFPDRILVPKSAILERDRRKMLFVYEGDENGGLAKWTYVTTGLENDSLVEIVENRETTMLQPGQIVLTDGHYTLIHDARVQLTTDRSAPGARPR